jgi:hypothetical protein
MGLARRAASQMDLCYDHTRVLGDGGFDNGHVL